jgi:nucleotide-binding universal stress UspA family protein
MFQRILIAWDGSPLALRALDVAIDLARRYEAELVAISVANSPADAETSADRSESAEAAGSYLAASFADVVDRAERAGVGVEHAIVEGQEPARALAEYAHEHGFDLLVCGHHHARRAGRLLLRGAVPALLEATSVPVLVISEAG